MIYDQRCRFKCTPELGVKTALTPDTLHTDIPKIPSGTCQVVTSGW